MKKFCLFIFTLVLAFTLFACGSSKAKNDPQVSNPNEVFASIKENGKEYQVTNKELYNYLKSLYGSTALVNLIDSKLLEDEIKAVTDEEIKEAIDKDCYGEEELSDEEKKEKEKKFIDNMFITFNCQEDSIYGASIKEQYAITLAQKAYAKKVLEKEVAEHDAKYAEYAKLSEEEQKKVVEDYEALSDEEKAETEAPVTSPYYADSKYAAKYADDNYSTFKCIVVSFTTIRQMEIALAQVNVLVKDGAWADKTSQEALTDAQVLAKFEELYAKINGKAADLEKEYSEDDLSAINTNVASYIKDSMDCYGGSKWYTPKGYEVASGDEVVLILKYSENLVKDFEDLTDEEKEAQKAKYLNAIISDSLTSSYCTTKAAELREDKNLVIYDSVIENSYVNSLSELKLTHEKTEEENATIVAKLDGIEITADQVFDFLVAHQGANGVIELLAEKRLLGNEKINTYYKDGKWLDEKMKEKVEETVEAEKTNFENGNYTKQGYDPTKMSFNLYIKAAYNVDTIEELKVALLLELITTEYASSINKVGAMKNKDFLYSDADANELWEKVLASMKEKANKLYKANAAQLLIVRYESVEDYLSAKNPVNPEEWTEEQKEQAKELGMQIIEYINNATGAYTERLKKVSEAFTTCPTINTSVDYNGKEVALTLGNIEVSKYKELGFNVIYNNLGTVQSTTTTAKFTGEETEKIIKALWDEDLFKDYIDNSNINAVQKATVYKEPVEISYGYSVIVKLKSLQVAYASVESVTVDDKTVKEYTYVPTLAQIRTYLKNSSDSSLTTNIKNSITTYYNPIATQLSGEYFTLVMKYEAINSLIDSYSCQKVSKDALVKYYELFKDYAFESKLTNISEDYIYVK